MRSKDYLPSIVKEDLGDAAITALIQKNPNLTLVQLKRVFSYTYSRLNSREGKRIYARYQCK